MWWKFLLIFLAIAVVALVAVVLTRTIMFKPLAQPKKDEEDIDYDADKSVDSLQKLVRCKTISYYDSSKEDKAEFEKFEKTLAETFPLTHKTCERIKTNGRAILLKWSGKSSSKPTVLMAHYDVVPVSEEGWSKPAFDGIIEDGYLWGRGTLDTKITLNGAINAVEHLISKGFVPENDLYLAFGGDEEINGNGAPSIVEYFKANGVKPALVVDEGGAVVEDVFPGVHEPCALIGIAEKGMLNVKLEIKGAGGHASAPPPRTSLGKLSQACVKMEEHPFDFRITKPAQDMFDTLGRYSSFGYRMVFANLWLFKGVLNSLCKKSGGEINALLRTTVAFTQASGSVGINVLPPNASMCANLRLIAGDTMESAKDRIVNTIADPDINLEILGGMNPSVISDTDNAEYEKLKSAVASTWRDAIVAPYLMVQCSDSRHYGEISDRVYRFSAMALTKEERSTIHGNDERIPVETIKKATEFYIRLVSKL